MVAGWQMAGWWLAVGDRVSVFAASWVVQQRQRLLRHFAALLTASACRRRHFAFANGITIEYLERIQNEAETINTCICK
jgi:hypothetical protein